MHYGPLSDDENTRIGPGFGDTPPPVTPKRSSQRVPLIIVSAVGLLVLAGLVGAAIGRGGPATPPAATTPSGPVAYADAGQIVTALSKPGLVRAAECKGEEPARPAISQQRCGSGQELIAVVFPSGQAADERVADMSVLNRSAGIKGAVVRGPNWMVNVGDFSADRREAIRAALGGTMVNTG